MEDGWGADIFCYSGKAGSEGFCGSALPFAVDSLYFQRERDKALGFRGSLVAGGIESSEIEGRWRRRRLQMQGVGGRRGGKTVAGHGRV